MAAIVITLVGAVYFILVQRRKPAHLQAPEGEAVASEDRPTTPATATSFDTAWDQYTTTTHAYNLEIQITPINSDGSFGTPATFAPVITEGSATSVTVANTALPAWMFRSAGGNSSALAY